MTGAAAIALVASALGVPVDEAVSAPPAPASGRLGFTDSADSLVSSEFVFGEGFEIEDEQRVLDGAKHIGEAAAGSSGFGTYLAFVSTKDVRLDDGDLVVDTESEEKAAGDVWFTWDFEESSLLRVTEDEDVQSHPAVDVVADDCEGILVIDIAYAAVQSGNSDIWVARLSNAATGTCSKLEIVDRQQVTADPAADQWPTWGRTHDGDRYLVFSSTRSDPLGDLFKIEVPDPTEGLLGFDRALDTAAIRLTDNAGPDTEPNVRPSPWFNERACASDPLDAAGALREPTWIAYHTDVFDVRGGLALIPLEGSVADEPLSLGLPAAGEPAWSPDGRYLAYRSTRADPEGDVLVGEFVRRCVDANLQVASAPYDPEGYEGDQAVVRQLRVRNVGLLDAEDVVLTIVADGFSGLSGPVPDVCAVADLPAGPSLTCDLGTVETGWDWVELPDIAFVFGPPGSATITSTVSTVTREADLSDNTNQRTYTILDPVPLAATLELDYTPVGYVPGSGDLDPYPGDLIDATLRITNPGRPDALDVAAVVQYSGGTPTGSVPAGCVASEGSSFDCDFGSLLAGTGDVERTFRFVAGPPGSFVVEAEVSDPRKGAPAQPSATRTIAAPPVVDLVMVDLIEDRNEFSARVFAELSRSGAVLGAGLDVVVSTWTRASWLDGLGVTLYEGLDCSAPFSTRPAPCIRDGVTEEYFSGSGRYGVTIPFALQDLPPTIDDQVEVQVLVEPARPAYDPTPAIGSVCVGIYCPEAATELVVAAGPLVRSGLAGIGRLVAVAADPTDDPGSIVELDDTEHIFSEGAAESHPTWLDETTVIATWRMPDVPSGTPDPEVPWPPSTNVSDTDAESGDDRQSVADEPVPSEGHPTYSPDGSQVAYHADVRILTTCSSVEAAFPCIRRDSQIVVADADGTDASVVFTAHEPGDVDTKPAWSPEGDQIAFTRWREGGQQSIWVTNLVDQAVAVTSPERAEFYGDVDEFDDEPAWSDDGATLAFTRARCDSTSYDGVVYEERGCATPPPAEAPPPGVIPPPSPEPVPIEEPWVESLSEYDSDIWVVDVATGAEEPLLETEVAAPPAPLDPEDPDVLCQEDTDTVCLGGDDRGPDWSPDGEMVVYEHTGWLWLADVSDLDSRVDAGPITGPRALMDPPYNAPEQPLYPDDPLDAPPTDPDDPAGEYYPDLEWAQDPSWSPNGDRIAFAGQPRGRPDDRGIYWLTHVPDDPDSREIREIAQLRQPELEPDWQPTADLAVTLTAVPTAVEVGDGATLTADVVNEGPAKALAAVAELTLPSGLTVGTLPGSCTAGTPITCDLGDMDEGDSLSLALPVTGAAAGTATSTVEVASGTTDPDQADNADDAVITVTTQPPVIPVADVSVTLAVDPPIAYWRKPQTLTVTTTNGGSVPSTVTLSVSVPAQSGPPPADPCLTATGCSLGSVAAQGTVVTTIPLLAADAFSGTATATIAGSVDDPNLDNNSASTALEMRRPTLRLVPPLGHPGFVTLALGESFPPGSDVRLRWQPGLNASRDVLPVEADGEFRTAVIVLHRDQLGVREISVTSETDLFDEVVVEFLVTPRTQSPPDFEGRG